MCVCRGSAGPARVSQRPHSYFPTRLSEADLQPPALHPHPPTPWPIPRALPQSVALHGRGWGVLPSLLPRVHSPHPWVLSLLWAPHPPLTFRLTPLTVRQQVGLSSSISPPSPSCSQGQWSFPREVLFGRPGRERVQLQCGSQKQNSPPHRPTGSASMGKGHTKAAHNSLWGPGSLWPPSHENASGPAAPSKAHSALHPLPLHTRA